MTLITASPYSPFPSVPARALPSFASYSTSSPQLRLGKDCEESSDDYKFMKNFTGCFVKLTQIVAETYLCEFFFNHSAGFSKVIFPRSCADFKNSDPKASSGRYVIDPDGEKVLSPFTVYCDMNDKNGVGVTVISHDSENRKAIETTWLQRGHQMFYQAIP